MHRELEGTSPNQSAPISPLMKVNTWSVLGSYLDPNANQPRPEQVNRVVLPPDGQATVLEHECSRARMPNLKIQQMFL